MMEAEEGGGRKIRGGKEREGGRFEDAILLALKEP